jgi:hypothetical protein
LAMFLRTRLVATAFRADLMSPQLESMTTKSMSLVGRYRPAQTTPCPHQPITYTGCLECLPTSCLQCLSCRLYSTDIHLAGCL